MGNHDTGWNGETLPLTTRTLIGLGCIVTPLLALAGGWAAATPFGDYQTRCLITYVPPLSVGLGMALWLALPGSASRWLRATVLIPVVHLLIAVAGWLTWVNLAPTTDADRVLPMLDQIPAVPVAVWASGMLIVFATGHTLARRRRRAPAWLHRISLFSLAHVLALGLWLPIVSHLWQGQTTEALWHGNFGGLAFAVLIPPTLAAIAVSFVSSPWVARNFPAVMWFLSIGVVVAITNRLSASFEGFVIYSNFVHVLYAEAAFALVTLVTLGAVHHRSLQWARRDASRPAPWVQEGTVVSDADEVGHIRFDGWTAGLRTEIGEFRLRTDAGDLRVPCGARLIAPLPSWTTRARVGQRLCVVSPGDRVIVSGFVDGNGAGPFRDGGVPVPGAAGMVVSVPRAQGQSARRDVLFSMWRPCLIYIVVATLAALPGVAALLVL